METIGKASESVFIQSTMDIQKWMGKFGAVANCPQRIDLNLTVSQALFLLSST